MNEPDPIVYIVEDDIAVSRSTVRLVQSAGYKVKAFPSAGHFLEELPSEQHGCLVLDVRLPGLDGMELQHRLIQSGIHLPIIFITGHGDIPMTVRAMKAGAVEFLTKPFRPDDLLGSIRTALKRDREALRERAEIARLRLRHATLTTREREVLQLIVTGLLNKQIADKLATTERTIKFHRAHIMQKMQAGSLAELVRMAGRLGLARPPE